MLGRHRAATSSRISSISRVDVVCICATEESKADLATTRAAMRQPGGAQAAPEGRFRKGG